MKSLRSLNPMIWKYRGRLFLGIVFIVLTNIFAVWAPSMIGEGVNALNDANRDFLVPLEQGVPFEELRAKNIQVPKNLEFLAGVIGAETVPKRSPESKQAVVDIVIWIGLLQEVCFWPTSSGALFIPHKTNGHCDESVGGI